MAAGGFKEFVAGETLDEDEINDFLMQGMLVFAGTAARGSAITSPVEGQFSFLKDSDTVEFYDSTQWVPLSAGVGAAVVGSTTGSPTVGTVSSGGTTYNVYSFTGSGSIIIDEAGFAELLLVGGGASGGAGYGAGGGAGGHLSIATAYLPIGTATVTVGAGGAAGVVPSGDTPKDGQNGFGSKIGDYVVPGGGAGAAFSASRAGGYFPSRGFVGGSGGGAAGSFSTTASGGGVSVAGLGNAGGDSTSSGASGGGGGAGAAGSNASSDDGGAGGNGVANSITGTSVTRAGGGGGAGEGSNASGGTGGGGAAAVTPGVNGTANTGGGGGGARSQNSPSTSGAGGSGIVIVRVAV